MGIASHLSAPERSWCARPPANRSVVRLVQKAAPDKLPTEYLDLLRYGDGGEGPLALPALYFMLYPAKEVAELNSSADQRDLYPGLFTFGSNGGLESIAFDTRAKRPWPVVMFDPVAGVESAVVIARDMSAFVAAIGCERRDTRRTRSSKRPRRK